MAEEVKNGLPSRSRRLFHIMLDLFNDFAEMEESGFQFIAGAFFEELHGSSIQKFVKALYNNAKAKLVSNINYRRFVTIRQSAAQTRASASAR
jgi:hypothetical protein